MNPDFAEILSELSAAGAEFIIVGAFAVAAHGNPRSTGGIDIWVRPTRENAERVLQALRAFGAPCSI
jgi:2,4-dienoyl-CoA reductase-like NADH-dependent reductase (Old Yellow Enzyme family)